MGNDLKPIMSMTTLLNMIDEPTLLLLPAQKQLDKLSLQTRSSSIR